MRQPDPDKLLNNRASILVGFGAQRVNARKRGFGKPDLNDVVFHETQKLADAKPAVPNVETARLDLY